MSDQIKSIYKSCQKGGNCALRHLIQIGFSDPPMQYSPEVNKSFHVSREKAVQYPCFTSCKKTVLGWVNNTEEQHLHHIRVFLEHTELAILAWVALLRKIKKISNKMLPPMSTELGTSWISIKLEWQKSPAQCSLEVIFCGLFLYFHVAKPLMPILPISVCSWKPDRK